MELKISLLAQDDPSSDLVDVIRGLEEIRDQKLQERAGDQKNVINNKRDYIRHLFNEAIQRIITQKLSTVKVKIADLGNACFDVSI